LDHISRREIAHIHKIDTSKQGSEITDIVNRGFENLGDRLLLEILSQLFFSVVTDWRKFFII
jgi:hypothetical protein